MPCPLRLRRLLRLLRPRPEREHQADLEPASIESITRLARLDATSRRPTLEIIGEAGLFHAVPIERVVCGPGDIAQAHAPNEDVELDQIVACENLIDRRLSHLTAKESELP